jgi:hypothetical protein
MVYHYETTNNYTTFDAAAPPPSATSDQIPTNTVPTPEYLMAHPDALKLAQHQCQDSSGPNVVAVCDNVHSAESGLLANEYRNAASGKP